MASASTTATRVWHRDGGKKADPTGPSDEQLLDRFLGGDLRDAEAAFRVLLERHGPMVLGVCRHVLNHAADAEDAFQATFLSLARNAGSIRDRRVLGRWLYEVSYRVALRSRASASRRRALEKESAAMSAGVGAGVGVAGDPAWDELKPVLHEEVNRLPAHYRSAVVLCYLEGHTNEEAARLLGWPVGTVKGRLSRARELFRSRLTRRGLGLSAAFLAVCLSKNAVFAEVVPSRLADLTAGAAVSLSRGGPVGLASLPPRVADLIEDAHRFGRVLNPRAGLAAAIGAVIAAALSLIVWNLVTFDGPRAAAFEGRGTQGAGPVVAFPAPAAPTGPVSQAVVPTPAVAGSTAPGCHTTLSD